MNKPSWVRWRITLLLIVASFVDYFLRFNLSLAAGTMMPDLGLSEIQWGWVMAAFPLGYAIFQLPGGVAADRFGPRRVLTLMMLAWGTLVLLQAMVPGPGRASTASIIFMLVVLGFAVGATHAPIYPTANCTIQRWFPIGRWALPNGLTSTGLTWGAAAVTPVLTGLILAVGWRQGFATIAPMAFVAAALWWWYVRDYPSQHHGVNAAEAQLIAANRRMRVGVEKEAGNWRTVVKNRDLLLLTLSYSCMNYGFWTAFGWLFYYLDSITEMGRDVSVTVTALQWIAGGFAAAIGGWLCDRLCRKIGFRWGCRGPIMVAMLCSGTLLIVGLVVDSATLAGACFVGFFFFNQFTEGPYWAASMAIGRRLAGSAGGVLNTGANAMGVITVLAGPVIADALGWKVAIGTLTPFAFVAAGLMMFVRADRPVKID